MKRTVKWLLLLGGPAGLLVAAFVWTETLLAMAGPFILFIVLLAIIGVLIVVLMLLCAHIDWWLTKPEQSTISFIDRGDTLKEIVPIVDGFRLSTGPDPEGRYWLVPEKDEEKRRDALFVHHKGIPRLCREFFWDQFRVWHLGFRFPQDRLHKFKISRLRLVDSSELPLGASIQKRIVPSGESPFVSSLRFVVPRALFLEALELPGDNALINVLLQPIYRTVIPTVPVYDFKGEFFAQLDNAIGAMMNHFLSIHRVAVYKKDEVGATGGYRAGDFAHHTYDPPQGRGRKAYEEMYASAPLTYAFWLKIPKTGEGSPIEQHFRTFNVSPSYLARLQQVVRDERNRGLNPAPTEELVGYLKEITKGQFPEISEDKLDEVARLAPSGILMRFGFLLVSLRDVADELHPNSKAVGEAQRNREVKRHEADAARIESAGKRDSLLNIAAGEKARSKALVEGLVEAGIPIEDAARIVQTQIRTENLGKNSKLTTYVEGSASILPTIPVGGQSPNTRHGGGDND